MMKNRRTKSLQEADERANAQEVVVLIWVGLLIAGGAGVVPSFKPSMVLNMEDYRNY